jgi:hypothetical protein
MKRKDKQNEEAKQRYRENRSKLIALSQIARKLKEAEEVDSVNEGLIYLYDQQQGVECEYNTFHQWKEKGCTIIKGVHAFCVWGQPKNVKQTPEGATEEEEYEYWPICYLFSDLQVINLEQKEAQTEQAHEQEPEPVEALEMDSILN